ncbi:hypothetical protein AC1031_014855 [Aphanomyces cochlioides]|nr:hypothetical protein AC1031_014855 [Aphanomyces cochlioides]
MQILQALFLAAAILAGTATSASCPYTDLNATRILTAGPLCLNATVECVVDNQCRRLATNATLFQLDPEYDSDAILDGLDHGRDFIDAVGDFSQWNNTLNKSFFSLENLPMPKLPQFITTSKQLVQLLSFSIFFPSFPCFLARWLDNTSMTDIPTPLAPSIFDLTFNRQPLNVSSLQTLPKSVSNLDLKGCKFAELAHLDLSNLTALSIQRTGVTSINNVTLTPKLFKTMYVAPLDVTNFVLDETSYTAVNALSPAQTQAFNSFAAAPYGFNATNATIVQDVALCNKTGGVVMPLWEMHTDVTRQTFTVCVVKSAAGQPVPVKMASSKHIIGAIVGGVAAVVAIAGFLTWRLRRKPDAEDYDYHRQTTRRSQGGTAKTGSNTRYMRDASAMGLDMSELTLVRLDQNHVIYGKKLASGAFADVFYGTYKSDPVAIKRLISSRVGVKEVQVLIDEIKLIASFTSPFVIKLIGCCWDQPSDLECILEFMDAGDLRDNLTTRTPDEFTWREKIHVMANIVDGLAYLHSLPVIHRDLKSRNVLMDSTKGAKLTDFGLSKEDTQETMTVGVGTYLWMAPEILQLNHYSVAADAYSFGMILSEMDSHKIPYADMTNRKNGKPLVDTAIMGMVIAATIKPAFSNTMPEWIRDMAMQCISSSPDERPTALILSSIIHKQIKKMG